MALNSYITPDGLEIGRAQAIQAAAAQQAPQVRMNPVLLKPEGEKRCQVVLEGKPLEGMSAARYHEIKPKVRDIVCKNLEQLRYDNDLVLIEGAGSPAEINLKKNDIVNMFIAKAANAPVLIVGDIDRGGVFASFIGTQALLDEEENALVAGFIINKFRGDITLLQDGVDFLEDYTKKKCFGVVPVLPNLRFAEEDSLGLEQRPFWLSTDQNKLNIVILRLPTMANYDEFDALEADPQVHVSYIRRPDEILAADLFILPGSKSTINDLLWLRKEGLEESILIRHRQKKPILAICGGCQMLGAAIDDPDGLDGSIEAHCKGLGIFSFQTYYENKKLCAASRGVLTRDIWGFSKGQIFSGYEIHMGRLIQVKQPSLQITQRTRILSSCWMVRSRTIPWEPTFMVCWMMNPFVMVC